MKSLRTLRGILAAIASLSCLGIALWAQDSESPDSLGDLGRQSRVQRAAAEGKSSKAQALVDEMQQEQEASDNAPLGFKSYDAGDYRLFVPFPYSLEGRENGGAVLLGSRLGVTNTEVMAGTPISVPPNVSDTDLSNKARQLASQFGPQAYCSAIRQGSHRAFRCSWQGNPYLLGHVVWGSMEFVAAANSLIPVMCVSPDAMHSCVVYDTYGHNTCSDRNARKTQAAIDASYRDERTTYQVCDQIIFPSIQLKEDIVVHPASIPENKTPRVTAPSGMTPTQEQPLGEPGSQSPSLAQLAREARQTPHGKAQATLDNAEGISVAPPGFKAFILQYCQNPQQCSEASVVIPEKAEVVSRTNGQHIFKTLLDGEAMMLYAGPADMNGSYRGLTDPDYIRMRDVANSNEWSHEKADAVSTQELTIEGRPALMTRFRYLRDQRRWWVGERALIENRGVGGQFLLGCTAPEEHFADAEALCTTLVNSLRLP